MELGQRLKQARLEKGLSQRQLCGEEITRNMLSQIENGSARPSMATLGYLARQLDKPISYFLEEQTVTSPNERIMRQLRLAYQQEMYEKIPGLLEEYRMPDEVFDSERYLLEALSLMGLAQQALQQGKDIYARTLLQNAAQAGAQTPYYTESMERERLLQLYTVQPTQAIELSGQLPEDDREQMLRAQAALDAGDFEACARMLDGKPGKSSRWYYLRGQAAMRMHQYALAAECFLQAEPDYPIPCVKALEQCYRELGDYKQAYFYACKQRQQE